MVIDRLLKNLDNPVSRIQRKTRLIFREDFLFQDIAGLCKAMKMFESYEKKSKF
jgi:hypothetical protein